MDTGKRVWDRTSAWFELDNQVNGMGTIESRHPGERGKQKYKELPIPAAVTEDE